MCRKHSPIPYPLGINYVHASLLKRFGVEEAAQPGELYACSYQPITRDERAELDVWEERLLIGELLPTIPLQMVLAQQTAKSIAADLHVQLVVDEQEQPDEQRSDDDDEMTEPPP